MQCPKCQAEVPDMHFFCTNCLTQVRSFDQDDLQHKRGIVERVGSVLIDVLLSVFIIGGSILIARQINWRELVYGFQRPPDAQTEPGRKKSPSTITSSVSVSSPVQARVYLDGQFSGHTPHTLELIPGDHQIKLVADGYQDWVRKVRMKNKQKLDIKASMKKKNG